VPFLTNTILPSLFGLVAIKKNNNKGRSVALMYSVIILGKKYNDNKPEKKDKYSDLRAKTVTLTIFKVISILPKVCNLTIMLFINNDKEHWTFTIY
jgi:hypothetical protein